MKAAKIILTCLVVTLLVTWTGIAQAVNFVNLVPGTEKWFADETNPSTRLHTTVSIHTNGYRVLVQEKWAGPTLLQSKELLYKTDLEGDVLFKGTRGSEFSDPILWVDAPLAEGKTWTDSRPYYPGNYYAPTMVHYVFAVLDDGTITCPAGTFPCYRVTVTTVSPVDPDKTESFWYNAECGIVMCDMEDTRFKLQKAFVNGEDYDTDYELHDHAQGESVRGLVVGPNPSNPMTNITFELKDPARVNVRVFDISGRLVRSLVTGESMAAGPVSITWKGYDDGGRAVASGTYFLRVQAGQTVRSDRITLVR